MALPEGAEAALLHKRCLAAAGLGEGFRLKVESPKPSMLPLPFLGLQTPCRASRPAVWRRLQSYEAPECSRLLGHSHGLHSAESKLL